MNSLANSLLGGSSAVEEPLVDLDEMMLTGILFNESKLIIHSIIEDNRANQARPV